jgi:hypothetical protein
MRLRTIHRHHDAKTAGSLAEVSGSIAGGSHEVREAGAEALPRIARRAK